MKRKTKDTIIGVVLALFFTAMGFYMGWVERGSHPIKADRFYFDFGHYHGGQRVTEMVIPQCEALSLCLWSFDLGCRSQKYGDPFAARIEVIERVNGLGGMP